ncbi:transglycosylase SLT domain-containing protein [Sorangium sp. So ce385]|uniref:transglycosylase SLT domain-containing protein n=1 Tax=Sorangium sp. So ce385 TaxID=3133308 RepID=UPI003F5C8D14
MLSREMPVQSTSGSSVRVPLRALVAALGLAALALHPGSALADIFTYTDADGTVHFSNRAAGDARFKVYIKGDGRRPGTRPGVAPVAPSDKSLERFSRYDTWIRQAATLYQIPEELVRAVIKCESDYDPRAVSPVGAQGLMQLMPETALRMQVRDPFDARENIFGGTRYLRILANLFNGDLDLTIAGYNAGEGAVMRHGGIPPYEETQAYVTRVRTYYARYRTTRDTTVASIEP